MATIKKEKIATGTAYKIDKNFKMPKTYADRRRFPFADMQVGDSFFIPASEQPISKARGSVYSAARSFMFLNQQAIKISSRVEKDGLRVWRIA